MLTHTLVVLCHSLCRTMAAAVLTIPLPRTQTCSLGFVFSAPLPFYHSADVRIFLVDPEAEMASRPSALQLPRRERKKMIRFDHACPWCPKPRITPSLSPF